MVLKNIRIVQLICIGFVILLNLAACSPRLHTAGREVRETGKASFYGGKFHGRVTASGERFNQNGLTAAHRTLPFGTKVKVKNLHNGKEVTVKINDRGPSSKSRVIDLSKGAAKKLGMIQAGVVSVELKYSRDVKKTQNVKRRKQKKYK